MTNDARYKRVILLGMDGLDPKILTALMEKGEVPNFSRLAESGSYSPLATSNPAQSPVAWATIAAGSNPGHHGVFDFLGRRVADYMPVLAVNKMNPKNMFAKREAMFLPVMQCGSFWDFTSDRDIPSTVLKWPMTFQPRQNKARLFSGLGVPDIKGGLGRYAFYSTRDISRNEEGFEKVVKVERNDSRIKTYIAGPNIAKMRGREEAKVDLNIICSDDSSVEISLDGKKVVLRKQQWSEWVEVTFKLGMMKTTSGIVKFYLNSINPDFELYMTPVQINPKDPAFIITNPDEYSRELAEEVGYFYTLGMPEDTKAIEEGRTDEEAFIKMCDEIIEEQEKMLWYEMDRFKNGVLASAFFSTDRLQHIFWVTRDPEHPLYDKAYAEKYGHVIDDCYKSMDRILGDVMRKMDEDTALIVFSDHGFTTFRRTVHLNSWLVENGFMTLTKKIAQDDKEGGALFQYVDWKKTRAFALGFGSIYLNLKGREKSGIVAPGPEAESVTQEIIDKLMELKDPKDGKTVVKNVYRSSDIYSGRELSASADLIVGFEDGFRSSWQTAIGGAPFNLVEDNLKKWSGDHIVDPSIVPGILLTNFKVEREGPDLRDIAPTVLKCFGMQVENIEGKSLL